MAFHYYTIDTIKNIDADNIPEAFISYFQGLSEEMKAEIADVRPDLVMAMSTDGIEFISGGLSDDIPADSESISDNPTNDLSEEREKDEDEDIDDDIEDDDGSDEDESTAIMDAWEEISIREWQAPVVEAPVVVCKIVPDHTVRCRIHRIPLLKKQLKIRRSNGAIYSIMGKLCPDCMDFFIEQEGSEFIIRKLNEYAIPAWIQPIEDTLAEWQENAVPQEFGNDTPIYVPDTWVDRQNTCPLHPESILEEDNYRKTYKDREVSFTAFYCNNCKKHIMRNALAQELEEECGEIGVPPITFLPLKKEPKPKTKASQLKILPDYFIHDGIRDAFDFRVEEIYWDQISEEDTVVVNYSRSCINDDHETEDRLALIKVQEKRSGVQFYLALVGYCSDCEKYYIAKEDLELIMEKGRPFMTLIDETGSFNTITSGTTYNAERFHLQDLERKLDHKIESIKNSPGFVEKYAVGDYDDGALAYAKKSSEKLYKEIDRIGEYKPKPYGYRTDLTLGDKTEIYYLGVEDINLDGNRQVISFNSDFGRKLVNYRTLEMNYQGKKWKVKRRRTFDIEKEVLYGFTEQSDEDVIFRSGITDSFLINVLNMRKKQHQLIDIISTIQENQNAIIDLPIRDNLIVQGCAGSGKTMVLLHRLSALKYNNPTFDFGSAVILTPSRNFNTHIAGLASSLQLGHIDRYSVEEYYHMILRKYDSSFRLHNPIADEMNVPQAYVDFLYSDEFQTFLSTAYEQVINGIRSYIIPVKNTTDMLQRRSILEQDISDCMLIETMLNELHENEAKYNLLEEKYSSAMDRLAELLKKKRELEQNLDNHKENFRNVVTAAVTRTSELLRRATEEQDRQISVYDGQIAEKRGEYAQTENNILPFRKTQRLNTISVEIELLKEQQAATMEKAAEFHELHLQSLKIMELDEQLQFVKRVAEHVPGVDEIQEEIQKLDDSLKSEESMLTDVTNDMQEAVNAAEEARTRRAPESLADDIKNLQEKIEPITPKAIYEEVFNTASGRTVSLLQSRTGKQLSGKYRGTHRYDLYLQLLFAMWFYQERKGSNTLICIDEAQDLAPSEYRLIKEINNDRPIFNVYGDTNQLLKKRGISDWSMIDSTVTAAKRFNLNENYRNTNQITKYCNDTFQMQVSQTGVDGYSVKEIARIKLERTVANLKNTEERIAIILPRAAGKKNKYIDMEQLPSSVQERIDSEVGNGKIAVVYVDEVKGVEFDRVFVVPNSMSKNEKYIAYTRALSELTVVYDERLTPKETPVQTENSSSNKYEEADGSAQIPAGGPAKVQKAQTTGSITVGKVNIKRDKKADELREKLRSKFSIVIANIAKTDAMAIVSPYSINKNHGATAAAVHKAAGKELDRELTAIPECEEGEVCLTKGYKLPCKYVIHANSPAYSSERVKESEDLLKKTYQSIMQCALEHDIKTIAIPSLSTGFKGFPKRQTAYIALETIYEFVKDHPEEIGKIVIVLYDDEMKKIYDLAFRSLGKDKNSRVSAANCKKCNKKIRIRKRTYDMYVLEGAFPSYCSSCSKETYEQKECSKCGEPFGITFKEKDISERTGASLPEICLKCREAERIGEAENGNTPKEMKATVTSNPVVEMTPVLTKEPMVDTKVTEQVDLEAETAEANSVMTAINETAAGTDNRENSLENSNAAVEKEDGIGRSRTALCDLLERADFENYRISVEYNDSSIYVPVKGEILRDFLVQCLEEMEKMG